MMDSHYLPRVRLADEEVIGPPYVHKKRVPGEWIIYLVKKAIFQYLNGIRIARARELLTTTSMRVSQISERVGFMDDLRNIVGQGTDSARDADLQDRAQHLKATGRRGVPKVRVKRYQAQQKEHDGKRRRTTDEGIDGSHKVH